MLISISVGMLAGARDLYGVQDVSEIIHVFRNNKKSL